MTPLFPGISSGNRHLPGRSPETFTWCHPRRKKVCRFDRPNNGRRQARACPRTRPPSLSTHLPVHPATAPLPRAPNALDRCAAFLPAKTRRLPLITRRTPMCIRKGGRGPGTRSGLRTDVVRPPAHSAGQQSGCCGYRGWRMKRACLGLIKCPELAPGIFTARRLANPNRSVTGRF